MTLTVWIVILLGLGAAYFIICHTGGNVEK